MNFISYVIKLEFHTSRLKLIHFSIVLSVFFSHVQQNEYAYHSKDRFLCYPPGRNHLLDVW